jgi:adenosylcobinamide-GDP ribazoletransferase
MGRMGGEDGVLQDLKVATLFLTRLPIHVDRRLALHDLARAVHLFPLIGVGVGAAGAIVYSIALAFGLPSLPATILTVAALILVTGALHEDGLADTVDGLGAGPDRLRALEIMRDSRIGSFGTIALVLSLLMRLIALSGLWSPTLVASVLISTAAVSRAAMPVVMLVQPSAREGGLAAGAGAPVAWRVGLGCALSAAVALVCLPTVTGLAAMATATVAAGIVATILGRRLGGCTGDTLGAVQQVAEIGFLMAIVARQ